LTNPPSPLWGPSRSPPEMPPRQNSPFFFFPCLRVDPPRPLGQRPPPSKAAFPSPLQGTFPFFFRNSAQPCPAVCNRWPTGADTPSEERHRPVPPPPHPPPTPLWFPPNPRSSSLAPDGGCGPGYFSIRPDRGGKTAAPIVALSVNGYPPSPRMYASLPRPCVGAILGGPPPTCRLGPRALVENIPPPRLFRSHLFRGRRPQTADPRAAGKYLPGLPNSGARQFARPLSILRCESRGISEPPGPAVCSPQRGPPRAPAGIPFFPIPRQA